MIIHMRTTLIIDDDLFRELKKRAAEQRRTLSEVTQDALRHGLHERKPARPAKPAKPPSFAMGKPAVDLSDRDQLYEILDRQ